MALPVEYYRTRYPGKRAEPVEPEDTRDFWARIADSDAARSAMSITSGFSNMVGAGIEEARAAALDLPSRNRLTPEGMADYAKELDTFSFDLPGRSYEVPGLEKIAVEGLAMGAKGGDLSQPGYVKPAESIPEAVARGVGEFGVGIVTDPIMAAYMKAGARTTKAIKGVESTIEGFKDLDKAAKMAALAKDPAYAAARAEQLAASAGDLATGAIALPGIAGGAVQAYGAAEEEFIKNGVSPQFAEQAVHSMLGAAALVMVGKDAYDYKSLQTDIRAQKLADGLNTLKERGQLDPNELPAEIKGQAGNVNPNPRVRGPLPPQGPPGMVPPDLQVPAEAPAEEAVPAAVADAPWWNRPEAGEDINADVQAALARPLPMNLKGIEEEIRALIDAFPTEIRPDEIQERVMELASTHVQLSKAGGGEAPTKEELSEPEVGQDDDPDWQLPEWIQKASDVRATRIRAETEDAVKRVRGKEVPEGEWAIKAELARIHNLPAPALPKALKDRIAQLNKNLQAKINEREGPAIEEARKILDEPVPEDDDELDRRIELMEKAERNTVDMDEAQPFGKDLDRLARARNERRFLIEAAMTAEPTRAIEGRADLTVLDEENGRGRVIDGAGKTVFKFDSEADLQDKAAAEKLRVGSFDPKAVAPGVPERVARQMEQHWVGTGPGGSPGKVGRHITPFLSKLVDEHGLKLPDKLKWLNQGGEGAFHSVFDLGTATKGKMAGKRLLLRMGDDTTKVKKHPIVIPQVNERWWAGESGYVQADVVEWMPSMQDVMGTGQEYRERAPKMVDALFDKAQEAGLDPGDIKVANSRFKEISIREYEPAHPLHYKAKDGKTYRLVISDFGAVGPSVSRAEPVGKQEVKEEKLPEKKLGTPNKLGFFSQLGRVIENARIRVARAKEWLNYLRDPKRAVKKDELKWSGLEDFLAAKEGPITVTDIKEFLLLNNPEVEELRYSEDGRDKPSVEEAKDYIRRDQGMASIAEVEENWGYSNPDDYIRLAQSLGMPALTPRPDFGETGDRPGRAIYGESYEGEELVIPGGKDYQEIVLRWPPKQGPKKKVSVDHHIYEQKNYTNELTGEVIEEPELEHGLAEGSIFFKKDAGGYYREHGSQNSIGPFKETASSWVVHTYIKGKYTSEDGYVPGKQLDVPSYFATEDEAEAYVKSAPTEVDDPAQDEAIGHHGVKGNLVHVRFNTRTDKDGKKVLFIEEIQSDRANAEAGNTLAPEGGYNLPFRDTYNELAMKRMIRWAAENGFERIAWTTGQQQIERYQNMPGEGRRHLYDRVLTGIADRLGRKWESRVGKTKIEHPPTGKRGNLQYDTMLANQLHNEFFIFRNGGNEYRYQVEDMGSDEGFAVVRYKSEDEYDVLVENISDIDAAEDALVEITKAADKKIRSLLTPPPPPRPVTSEFHSLDITEAMRKSVMEEGFSQFQEKVGKGEVPPLTAAEQRKISKIPLAEKPGDPKSPAEASQQAQQVVAQIQNGVAPQPGDAKTKSLITSMWDKLKALFSESAARGIVTLRAGLLKDIKLRGFTSLVGYRLDLSSYDSLRQSLAVLQAVNRAPFEVGHALGMKNGTILRHEAMTSYLADRVKSSDLNPTLEDLMDMYVDGEIDMITTMHNHPGGRPVPSQADKNWTKATRDKIYQGIVDRIEAREGRKATKAEKRFAERAYLGEVITNHDEYGYVGKTTEDAVGGVAHAKKFTGKYLEAVGPEDPIFKNNAPELGDLDVFAAENNTAQLAAYAKSTFGDDGSVKLFYFSNSSVVRRIESVPMKTFMDTEFMNKHLRAAAVEEGGGFIMAIRNGKNTEGGTPEDHAFRWGTSKLIGEKSLEFGFVYDDTSPGHKIWGVDPAFRYQGGDVPVPLRGGIPTHQEGWGLQKHQIPGQRIPLKGGTPAKPTVSKVPQSMPAEEMPQADSIGWSDILKPGKNLGDEFRGENYHIVDMGIPAPLANDPDHFRKANALEKAFIVVDKKGDIVDRYKLIKEAVEAANNLNRAEKLKPTSREEIIRVGQSLERHGRTERAQDTSLVKNRSQGESRVEGTYTVEAGESTVRGGRPRPEWHVKDPAGKIVGTFMIRQRAAERAAELTAGGGRRKPGEERLKKAADLEREKKAVEEGGQKQHIFSKEAARKAGRARAEARGEFDPEATPVDRARTAAEEIMWDNPDLRDQPINEPAGKGAAIDRIKGKIETAKPVTTTGHKPPVEDINIDRITADPMVKGVLQTIGKEVHPDLWRAEVQHWDDVDPRIKQLFDLQSPEDYARFVKKRGRPLNQAEMKMFRMIAVDESLRTQAALDAVTQARASGNVDRIRKTEEAYTRQVAWEVGIQMELANKKTEAARILNSLRQAIGGELDPEMTFLGRLISSLKRAGLTQKQAAELAIIYKTSPGAFPDALRNMLKPSPMDKFLEFWKSGLVSGPATHIANIASNSLFRGLRDVENLLAVGIDWARAGITGTERKRFLGELVAAYGGYKHTIGGPNGAAAQLLDGLRAIWDLKALPKPFPGSAMDLDYVGAWSGKPGEIIRTPFKFLELGDTFFKHLSAGQEVYRRAYRMARKLPGGPTTAQIEQIAQEMLSVVRTGPAHPKFRKYKAHFEEIQKIMKRDTFQADLGPLGANIQGLARHPLGAILLPFVKTPANILKETLLRTPGALLYKDFWKSVADFRAGNDKAGEAAEELAKVLIGSTIGAAMAAAAYEGLITGGGPTDPKLQEIKKKTGWEPYSLHIGDQYISYQRLEPLSSIIGLAADLAEGVMAGDTTTNKQKVQKLIGSLAENLTSKTFLSGLEGFFTFWHDPVRYGERWVKQLEGSLVPNIIGATARAVDPVYRQTEIGADPIINKIPFASRTLPAARTPTGEPRMRRGIAIERFASPFNRSTENKDPAAEVYSELERIEYAPATIKSTVSVRGKKIPITRDERELLAAARERATARLRRVIRDPRYKSLPDNMDDPRTNDPRWLDGRRDTKQKVVRNLYERFMEEESAKVKKAAYKRFASEYKR